MQRDRGRVGHGDGARIGALRGLEKILDWRLDGFGVSPVAPAAEIIVIAAAGEIAGQALVADAARKHRRDAHELADVVSSHAFADLDDLT